MSSFTPDQGTTSEAAPDPTKHVNYTLGMVLGDDDFKQEFAYLSERDQWLARDLLGYGTVCGLEVGLGDSDPSRVEVSPGVALSPHGQLIRVDPAQCAYLNIWITDKKVQETLNGLNLTKSGDVITLYLKLCYRDCPTNPLPVAGEPCSTGLEDESTLLKPSRIQDDFYLDFDWSVPDQEEENTIRKFVAWLRQIKVTETITGNAEDHLKAFAQAVRDIIPILIATPSPLADTFNDLDYGSPVDTLSIPGSLACEYLRLAFRIWTTEMRGYARGATGSCVIPPEEDCVLLSELKVPVSYNDGQWSVVTSALDPAQVVDQEHRPYLIHLRLVQEWLTCGRSAVLTPADSVVSEKDLDGHEPSAGVSELYSRADHTHGAPAPLTLKGDVWGPLLANWLNKIQSLHVSRTPPAKPAAGQVLMLVPWKERPVLRSAKATIKTNIADKTIQPDVTDETIKPNLSGEIIRPDLPDDPLKPAELVWQAADLPALPTIPAPSGATPTTIVFDQKGDPGSGSAYSLGNHRHGVVPLSGDVSHVTPIRPLGQKIERVSNELLVTGIQGFPVIKPTDKETGPLTFDGKQWQVTPPAAAAGNFVDRKAGPYAIVAAGVFKFSIEFDMAKNVQTANAGRVSFYNGFDVDPKTPGVVLPGIFGAGFHVIFNGYEPKLMQQYVVKLTPWVTSLPFTAFVMDKTPKDDNATIVNPPEGIQIAVSLLREPLQPFDGLVMVEISLFDNDPVS